MARKKGLSERQEKILEYIWRYSKESGRPPTIREIGQDVGISSTSVVNYNLSKLADLEYLRREQEVSRGLRLTDKALVKFEDISAVMGELFRVPVVGSIVASAPVDPGDAIPDETIELSAAFLPEKKDDLFALKVRGDSMIDAMVNDGDTVIMEKAVTAKKGEMVAAWIKSKGETTLKYFHPEGDKIRLQPANPTLKPFYYDADDVEIQGKVVTVMRKIA